MDNLNITTNALGEYKGGILFELVVEFENERAEGHMFIDKLKAWIDIHGADWVSDITEILEEEFSEKKYEILSQYGLI